MRVRSIPETSLAVCGVAASSFWLKKVSKSLRVLSSKDIVWNGRHFVIFLHLSDSSEAWLVGGLCVTSTAPSPSQHDCTGSQPQSNEVTWSMLGLGCRRGGVPLTCPALGWGCVTAAQWVSSVLAPGLPAARRARCLRRAPDLLCKAPAEEWVEISRCKEPEGSGGSLF